MKKLLFLVLIAISVVGLKLNASPTTDKSDNINVSELGINSGVVFRTTQTLTASDGEKMRLYRDGTCEFYASDGEFESSCKYSFSGKDFKLINPKTGETLYLGEIWLTSDGQGAKKVYIGGKYFYK